MLKIKNTTDTDFADRYDGRDYYFPSGKTVRVMEDVAHHIFGFGESDKIPYLLRLGWVRTSLDVDSGMKKLGMFKFSVVEYREDEDEDLPTKTPTSPGVAEATEEEVVAASESSVGPALQKPKRSILSNLAP